MTGTQNPKGTQVCTWGFSFELTEDIVLQKSIHTKKSIHANNRTLTVKGNMDTVTVHFVVGLEEL